MQEIAPTPPAPKASRVRWLILAMLFFITTINYADRSTISFAGPEMMKQFGLTGVQMGYIFAAFSWAYVVCQLPGGWLLDRFGSKMTYFWSIFIWSLLTMLVGSAGFFAGAAAAAFLYALRFLIGAAEAPSFPGNSRIASACFPTAERGTAAAVFNSAQYFAQAAFAPLMGWMVHAHGWQSVFYVMGGLGIVMSLVWLKTIYGPKNHPRINAAELDYIERGGGLVDLDGARTAAPLRQIHTWAAIRELLSNRMLLGIYIAQYCIVTMTWFFLTWFPVYLVKERHLAIHEAGLAAALPAIFGFLGGILGGLISDRMIKSGFSLTVARKAPIVCGMLISMTIIICNYVNAQWMVIALMTLAFFGKGLGALGWSVVSDTSPKEASGLSGALFNTFGNSAGITTPIVIGYIWDKTGSFEGALTYVGITAAGAVFCYLFVVGEIKRVHLEKSLMQPAAADAESSAARAAL